MSPETDNSPDEEASRFTALCYKAEEAALRLIARAEQNSFGLMVKLERKGFDTTVIKAVISGLLDHGLLDDERYAALWLRSRLVKKAQSPKWLIVSLRKKGIDRHSSHKALEKVLDPDAEYALLLRYIAEQKSKDSCNKAKLKYEGFSSEVLERYFDESCLN